MSHMLLVCCVVNVKQKKVLDGWKTRLLGLISLIVITLNGTESFLGPIAENIL